MNTDVTIRISLDLQFFSADDEGKTEKATPKKREDARKKGQVAKSTEINTAFLFIFAFSSLKLLGTYMKYSLQDVFIVSFQKISSVETVFESYYMGNYIAYVLLAIIKIVGPLLTIIMVAGVISSFIHSVDRKSVV